MEHLGRLWRSRYVRAWGIKQVLRFLNRDVIPPYQSSFLAFFTIIVIRQILRGKSISEILILILQSIVVVVVTRAWVQGPVTGRGSSLCSILLT